MENASKALLIAGGVLIAILLLTIFSYLFGQMAASSSKFYAMMEEHEIAEFNQKFLNYKGRGEDEIGKNNDGTPIYNYLTIQDVVTIVNLAKDNNNSKKRKRPIKILVNGNDWSTKTENDLNDIMQSNLDTKYICPNNNGVMINGSTKLVETINISKV